MKIAELVSKIVEYELQAPVTIADMEEIHAGLRALADADVLVDVVDRGAHVEVTLGTRDNPHVTMHRLRVSAAADAASSVG